MILIMMELSFLFEKKISARLKKRTIFALMCFVTTLPIYCSDQKFENLMDLLLLTDGDKSRYEHIKDFSRFMFHKIKKKTFAKVVYSALVLKMC